MELGVPHRHLEAAGVQPGPPQAGGHGVRQHRDAAPDLRPRGEVLGEGGAVAHGLHHLRVVPGADRVCVQAVGVVVELGAHLAHHGLQGLFFAGGQLTDGADAELGEQLLRRAAHIQQRPHRQRPDDVPPVLPGDDGGGVGLFVVAAQLGEHLVEGDPHGESQPHLPLHPLPQPVRHGPGVPAQQVEGVGDVQPALVDAEGLHQIRVLVVDGVDLFGDLPVQIVVRRQQHQSRTLLLRLPDGLRRLDAVFLGRLVLGQDDAVAGGGVPADGHRHVPQVRPVPQLHGGVKAVEIAVENDPVHGPASFPPLS